MLSDIKNNLEYVKVNRYESLKNNYPYYKSVEKHKNREKFLKNLDKYALEKLVKKYIIQPFPKRIVIKLKSIIKKININIVKFLKK